MQTEPGEKCEKVILEKPEERLTCHCRPLYIQTYMEDQPINQVLLDNRATINILPTNVIKKLHNDESDLITTEVTVYDFSNRVSNKRDPAY